jgi:TonB family protein
MNRQLRRWPLAVGVLLFIGLGVPTLAAQADNPELVSANIPFYPPLARQARVYGTVTISFTLRANGGEPANVEAVSGHPMLKSAAVENVKTWRFRNTYAVERKYETTFHYTLSEAGSRRVTFESFKSVEIVSPRPPPLDTHF